MAPIQYKTVSTKLTRIYDVGGQAPDTPCPEGSKEHPRTVNIRPRELSFISFNQPDPTIVTYVAIDGRVVRKSDGQLGPGKTGLWRARNTYLGIRDELPTWIMEILEAEGLSYGDER